ncbi:hypothetical protein Tco_0723430 [Tanacetum coccineum]
MFSIRCSTEANTVGGGSVSRICCCGSLSATKECRTFSRTLHEAPTEEEVVQFVLTIEKGGKNHYVASRISAGPFSAVSMKNNVTDCNNGLYQYSIFIAQFLLKVVTEWEVCDSNTGSVVATENTGSDVVGMENEDSDGDGTVNGGVGYGKVIVKV